MIYNIIIISKKIVCLGERAENLHKKKNNIPEEQSSCLMSLNICCCFQHLRKEEYSKRLMHE